MRILVAASAILMLALTGCSTEKPAGGVASANGGGSASSGPATSTSMSNEELGIKFAQCMRDNGVNVPDPDPDGGFGGAVGGPEVDRNSPEFKKGMDACKQYLPGGGDLSKMDPKLIDQLRQLTQCLRDNGVNVPDPDPNSPMLGLGGMADIDRTSPAFQKAMEACKDKVPGRPGQ
jgi:hypothetical protein